MGGKARTAPALVDTHLDPTDPTDPVDPIDAIDPL